MCLLLVVAASQACTNRTESASLDIATTTSVQNSGLLAALLPAYRAQSGTDVRVHAAGSGRALQMMSEGLVRLVISHAPEAEIRALGAHPEWDKQTLAHNWFVVVGPAADPAVVRQATNAADAFRRIAQSGASFVSRGDNSGTHERELSLWDEAGVRPPENRRVISGRGMAQALRHADELQGYTLSDEATFRQVAPALELELLFAGDDRLLNTYSVIYSRADQDARELAEWLVRGEGHRRIDAFRADGYRVFTTSPAPRPAAPR